MYHTAHPFASIVTGVPFTGFLFTVFQFSDRFSRLKRRQPIPVRECLFSFSYVIVCDYRKFLFIGTFSKISNSPAHIGSGSSAVVTLNTIDESPSAIARMKPAERLIFTERRFQLNTLIIPDWCIPAQFVRGWYPKYASNRK